MCRFNLPFVPGIAGVSIFWIRQEIHMLITLIKNGRICAKASVCCENAWCVLQTNISRGILLFPIFLVQELMKDVWSTTHAAKRNILLCLFAQILVYNEGKQCWLVFCFPENTETKCWIRYKSRESEPSIPMSLAAREVITPGQDIKRPFNY